MDGEPSPNCLARDISFLNVDQRKEILDLPIAYRALTLVIQVRKCSRGPEELAAWCFFTEQSVYRSIIRPLIPAATCDVGEVGRG